MALITVKNVGQFGVVTDLPAHKLPVNAWSAASNMRFADGCAERFKGDAAIFSAPSVVPYYIAPYQIAGKRYWLHAGLSAVFADDGTTRTDITGTAPTGAATDYWNGGVLNGVAVLNNGKDNPMFWGGDTALNLATLTGWNTNWKAKVIRPFKNYLVALDVTKTATRYPHMVKWSHSAVPGSIPSSWDETDVTKDAGEVDLAEEASAMVDALPLGDTLIIYKERSMYAMQYIGQPSIFRFQRLPGDVGMLTQKCGVSTPIGHVVLTAGDVVANNGQGVASIANAQVRKWIFQNIDSANYRNTFVAANPAKNEVWVCIPEAGNTFCTVAAVFNWIDKTWAFRDVANLTHAEPGQVDYTAANTWDSDTGTWDSSGDAWNQDEFSPADARLLLASYDQTISIADSGTSFSGTAFTSVLERVGMSLDTPGTVKLVRGVRPRFDATAGTQVQIEVGGSMDSDVPPTWSDPVTYTVGTSQRADTFASGKFLSLRITSVGAHPWRLNEYDLDIIEAGAY